MKPGDIIQRGSTTWELLKQGEDGRWWARSNQRNTAWLQFSFQVEPEDDVVCICIQWVEGFTHDVETGLYVHAECGKPKREHLEGTAARMGAWT